MHEKYGDRMLTWRVKEVDDTNWVFAFPNGITKKRNLATMDLFQAFVEGYSDEATCSKREGFESLFPLIDNTTPVDSPWSPAPSPPPPTQESGKSVSPESLLAAASEGFAVGAYD